MVQIVISITIFLDLKLFKQLWFSFFFVFLSLIDTEYNTKENKDQTSLKCLNNNNNNNNKNIETQHIVESQTFAVSSRILKFLTVVRLMMEQK